MTSTAAVGPRPWPATRRPAEGPRPAAPSHAARGCPACRPLVSRLFFVAGVLLILETLFPGVAWVGFLVDVCSTLLFPVDEGSIGFGVFLLLLGATLARRKRVGWVLALVIFGFFLLTDLAVVTGLVASLFALQTDFSAVPVYARFAFNLAALGALTACLVHYRAEFTARRAPGSVRKALLTLWSGWCVTVGVAMALVTVFPNELVGPRGRLAWILERLGRTLFSSTDGDLVAQPVSSPPGWISTVVGLLLGLTLLAAVVMLTRSQRLAALMSPADEPLVRALVAQSGEDSLAYFATRRDKSVVFAPDGGAAVTYRVDLGVCLASSDPIGPPARWESAIRAWQGLIDTYGWTPAVVGASEAGATAYARDLGLRVIRIGDEAVLHPRDFHLADRDMRPVRQAVQRLERLGYTVRVRRHRDLPGAELTALVERADAWRDTESERGFSMALGRLGDPADADCLMVEALLPARAPRARPGRRRGRAAVLRPLGDRRLLPRRDAAQPGRRQRRHRADGERGHGRERRAGDPTRLAQLRRVPQRLRGGRADRCRSGPAAVAAPAARRVALVAVRVALPLQREVPPRVAAPLPVLRRDARHRPRRHGARRGRGLHRPALLPAPADRRRSRPGRAGRPTCGRAGAGRRCRSRRPTSAPGCPSRCVSAW